MSIEKLLSNKNSFVSKVRSDASVRFIIDQLATDEVPAVVITDNDRDVLGIISHKEIVTGLKEFGESILDKPACEVMTSKVITCDNSEPMHTIYDLMDTYQVNYIPILKSNKLCGIINILDVIKHRLEEINRESNELRKYVYSYVA